MHSHIAAMSMQQRNWELKRRERFIVRFELFLNYNNA